MEAMDVKYRPVVFPNGGSVRKVKQQAAAAAAAAAVVAVGAGEVVLYRECLKNHAATMGGHALDGCGEFMPMPEADPSTFSCGACGCHRNFHRRMVVERSPTPPALPAPPIPASVPRGQHVHRGEETPEGRLPAVDADDSDSDSDGSEFDDDRSVSPPPPLIPMQLPAPVAQQPPPPPPPPYFASAPHMLLSLSSSAPGGAMPAQRVPVQVSPATAPPHGAMPARKRFRTKFTPEQKQRMQELSERLGWRLQKRDEAIVDEWCRDIGVSKGVFKVWMHNNKHNYLGGHSARRSASAAAAASSAATTPTGPAAAGPFRLSAPAPAAAPPPFNPSTSNSSPAPTATGFNINGTASSAAATVAHPENGASSQSA